MVRLLLLLFALCCTFPSEILAQAPEVKPTPQHEMLHKLAGKWKAVVTPAGATEGSQGFATYKVVCQGLWVENTFEMEDGSFSGRGLEGYDVSQQKFVSVWVDSMITAPLNFEGTYDERTKTQTLTATGQGYDGKPATYESVTVFPDADHMEFTLSLSAGGQTTKLMSIIYTRQK